MDQLTEHLISEEKRLLDMDNAIKEMRTELTQLSSDVADLVSAWRAANWLVGLVKWIGGIAISVTAFLALVKGIK
jgi:hypothetical protein